MIRIAKRSILERTLSDCSLRHARRLSCILWRCWYCSPDCAKRFSKDYARLGPVRTNSDRHNRAYRISLRCCSPYRIAAILGWHRSGHLFPLRLACQLQARSGRIPISSRAINVALPWTTISNAAGNHLVLAIQCRCGRLAVAKEPVELRTMPISGARGFTPEAAYSPSGAGRWNICARKFLFIGTKEGLADTQMKIHAGYEISYACAADAYDGDAERPPVSNYCTFNFRFDAD
jgi:hypothetical protein